MGKNSFLLYGNYEEQVKRLNDAQAGELFKIILHYVNTGEMRKSSDALVDMVFSMIAFQLGFDMKRYEVSCEKRREAGRKAGKASAEKRAKAKQEMKASANVNDCQRIQHDTDTEIDTEPAELPLNCIRKPDRILCCHQVEHYISDKFSSIFPPKNTMG